MNRRTFLNSSLLSAAAFVGASSRALPVNNTPGAGTVLPGVEQTRKFITSSLSVTMNPRFIQVFRGGVSMVEYAASETLQFPAFVRLMSPQTHLPLSPINVSPAIAFVCDSVSGTNYSSGGLPGKPISHNNAGQIRSTGLQWGRIRNDQLEFYDNCYWYDSRNEPQLSDRRRFQIVFWGSYRYGIYADIVWNALKTIQVSANRNCLFGVQPCAALSPFGGGQMMNSRGETQPARIWGQQANWMTCWGQINGKATAPHEGLALMNHPTNPWGTSPWNVANSGYMSPTSFPFLSKPWTFRAGQSLQFRYLTIAYAGSPAGGTLDEIYRSYIQE